MSTVPTKPEITIVSPREDLHEVRLDGQTVIEVADQLERLLAQLPTWEASDAYPDRIRFSHPLGGDVSWYVEAKREDVCDPRVVDGKIEWLLLERFKPPEERARDAQHAAFGDELDRAEAAR